MQYDLCYNSSKTRNKFKRKKQNLEIKGKSRLEPNKSCTRNREENR